MDLIILSGDPFVAARSLCDQHLDKQLEAVANILSGAIMALSNNKEYTEVHYGKIVKLSEFIKVPRMVEYTKWACEYSNYYWLCLHGCGLSAEIQKINNGKVSKIFRIIEHACQNIPQIFLNFDIHCDINNVKFPYFGPEEFKRESAVDSYRCMYIYSEREERYSWYETRTPEDWYVSGMIKARRTGEWA